jgi:CheY-like chemotaxis protein
MASLHEQVRVESDCPGAVTPLRATILIVEDDVDHQKLLRNWLEQAGATVNVVGDGEAAIRAVMCTRPSSDQPSRPNRFDVVLMNFQMPVMDGLTATRALREEGYAGKIIAITACALPPDREKCLAAGCDDYLAKPLTRENLIEHIRNHVSARTGPHAHSTQKFANEAGVQGAPNLGARPVSNMHIQ